ncbi:hypothetical protein K402DRAFT_320911 [Aulographum hederae CBS 113979]|uniref:NAD(P)-binding domain-containing protein n=1 Tax=Aulographum hederae CBS 113979 TaxID=1176131 RepID=A0A6G1HH34_9PEZI|nr:hypothetical protein K402DRAFT_320911 [Aulographum hederae CBS 113979]
MKLLITGATGAIGGMILEYALRNKDITKVIALTRKPLPNNDSNEKLESVIVQDFSNPDTLDDKTWSKLGDADAMVWAMGTYNLNEDVNLKYPLAFQEALAKRIPTASRTSKFKFILLSGAFVEPDQSKWLYFLGDERRMKGVLQTKTIEFAETHQDFWTALVIRPGGVLFGGDTYRNGAVECLFGESMAIRGEELAAFVTGLVVNGSQKTVIENAEMVEGGRELLKESD